MEFYFICDNRNFAEIKDNEITLHYTNYQLKELVNENIIKYKNTAIGKEFSALKQRLEKNLKYF